MCNDRLRRINRESCVLKFETPHLDRFHTPNWRLAIARVARFNGVVHSFGFADQCREPNWSRISGFP
jgi:hypothetical protein